MKQLQWEVTRGEKNHGTLVPEPCIFIRLFLRKKIKFYMRGAESSKQFMSYEIYFELEYHYLWSNCNRRSLGEKKSHGTLVPEPCIFIGLFLRNKIKFYMRGAESSK